MANSKKNNGPILNNSTNQAANFEEAYNRLAETTAQLERGGLTLEQSLALYEEGVALAQRCEQLLAQAELRVSQLAPAPTPSATSAAYSVNATRTYIFATDEDEDETDDNEEDFDDEDLRKALEDLQF